MFTTQWKAAIVSTIVFQVITLVGSESFCWLAALILIFGNGVIWIMRRNNNRRPRSDYRSRHNYH